MHFSWSIGDATSSKGGPAFDKLECRYKAGRPSSFHRATVVCFIVDRSLAKVYRSSLENLAGVKSTQKNVFLKQGRVVWR